MPSKHNHPNYGGCTSPLLKMLQEHSPGFCPLCEMEKMYHNPETPPKLKVRLRQDLAAYGCVVGQDPSPVIDAGDLL